MIAAEVNRVRTSQARDLAAAVRRVNHLHHLAGSPSVPELDQLWIELTRRLELAEVAGDDEAALRAIAHWRITATAVLGER